MTALARLMTPASRWECYEVLDDVTDMPAGKFASNLGDAASITTLYVALKALDDAYFTSLFGAADQQMIGKLLHIQKAGVATPWGVYQIAGQTLVFTSGLTTTYCQFDLTFVAGSGTFAVSDVCQILFVPATVAITGGAINGTPIGATTPSTGAFTTLSATGNATLGDAVGDAHTINGALRNTPGTNKHILSASVTASAIADFTTGGAGWLFSRPDDGVDGLGAVFEYISSGGLYNLALVARDDLVFATGGGGLYGSAIDRGRITAAGDLLWKHSIKSNHATAGIGYATGAGGTVTQGAGSGKTTGVTLNKACGQITMNNATLNAGVAVTFTFTNSAIAATDYLVLTHAATGTLGNYELDYRCTAGSATIYVRNKTAGNLSDAVVIGFAVIKGVTS